jgi:hypothetical protein
MPIVSDIGWGKKMIKVTIRFWTDGLGTDADKKTAWEYGTLTINANNQRGIYADHVFFNTLNDLTKQLGQLLKRNEITLRKRPNKSHNIDYDKI